MKLRALITTLWLAACAPTSAPPATPPLIGAPVVYGDDDRRDWFELEIGPLKDTTRDSAVALIGLSDITIVGDRVTVPSNPTLTDTYTLCADQRYRTQPTAAFCSGTLIDDDLVLTAGHCITSLSACANNAFVFDYLYTADGELAELTPDSIYKCAALHVAPGRGGLPQGIDLAILQLDRPVPNRRPAAVSTRGIVNLGDTLTMQGFPNGIPLKVSTGTVKNVRNQGDYVTAAVDAFHGDSGAGLRNADLEIIGVLTDGADDYVSAGSCAQTNVLAENEAVESVYLAKTAIDALCALGFPSPTLCRRDPSCGDGFCTGGETPETCPQDCTGLFAVPDAWTCSARWYDAGDDCDCDCGTYDPDCDDTRLRVTHCGVGSKCMPDGTCDVPIPDAWTCARDRYNNGQQCDCDCGVYDPDCDNPNARVVNCAVGGRCRADGTCTASIPREWTCRTRYYDAGDGCDCECGAYDPDCDDPREAVYNCSPGSTCLADGSCEIPIPAEWACDSEHYAAGDACDCRCGIVDPDCQPGIAVSNCAPGDLCSNEGTCTTPPLEPEPEPQPELVEPGPEPEPEPQPEVAEEEPEVTEESPEADPIKGSGDGGCQGGTGLGLMSLAVLSLLSRRRPSP